jgi:bacterioferritin-associated ferredoxin
MTYKQRTFWLALFTFVIVIARYGQSAKAIQDDQDGTITVVNKMVVEASCGQCNFGLKGTGCELSVRIDGNAYYVDGTKMDDLGDAHAADGMCNAIRLAKVNGSIKHGRFVATSFELLPSTQEKLVEASCGECQFGLEGTGCDLAVRIDGKGYYVDGAKMDDQGDAHAADGMCNAIRKARVEGSIQNGRFVATSFELLPFSKEISVEASCGECQFGLEGKGCDLAVRIDGKAYYVDGATMNDFGDAHGDAGMCNTIRSAKVKGSVKNDRFVATSFKLLSHDVANQKKKSRLGIALALDGESVVIDEVFENSAAEKSGLKKGDQIIEINKTEVLGLEQDKLIALFKKSATLDFSIMRDGKTLEFTVKVKAN